MKKLLLFFMSFFTLLGFSQFPEGFEGATFPPAGWVTFQNANGPNREWTRTNTATLVFAGTWSARIDGENVTDGLLAIDWLVSPQVLIPTNGQVRFYARDADASNRASSYSVRISTTSQTDPLAFTTVQTWTETDFDWQNYQQKFVSLAAYVGQNVHIAFVMENDNGDRWLIDQIKVDSRCLAPTALTSIPLATSATLSWNTASNPTGPWEIEYGPAGFAPGTGTIVPSPTGTLNLTGLSPLTSYTYFVRTLCDTDNPSPWSASHNFLTSALPPVCGGNFVDTGGPTGTYSNNEDYIVTICPTNPGEYVTVVFNTFVTETNWDKLYVYDGNSITSPQISSGNGGGNGPVTLPGGFWGNLNGNLPGPFEATSASGCITFRFVSDGSSNNFAGWTSNIICEPFPTCPKPSNLTSVAVNSTSVNVSWTNNAPTATSWEVIAVPAGSPSPTAAQTGQITTNPSPYTYTGLTSQTTYDFYVRAICAPGTDVGPWSTRKTTATTQPNFCAGDHFYDLGGPTGNYPNNVTAAAGTTTICAENPGDVVTVFFNSFNLVASVGDTLTIYDGDDTTGAVVGVYFGSNIIPFYTASSASGCLTFVFVSNGSQNAPGWDATIVCGPPCPLIVPILDSSTPVAGADEVIRICQGETVTFNGSGTFAGNGVGATYEWDFDDAGAGATGVTASHTFDNPGVYLVNLTITDVDGCRSTLFLNQKVYVSTTPTITTTTTAYRDEICLGQSTTFTGDVTFNEFIRECAPPVSGTTFLPDGNGVSYQSFVPVDCFPFGSTITSASQITSVCIDMEHSYLGDLEIRLVSPNGQSVILKQNLGLGHGGGTYLGCPIDNGPGPGTGRLYCFTPTATTILVDGTTSNCGTPSGASKNPGDYRPEQSFNNLIGSTLNGNWALIVTDNFSLDDGYIFSWGINFDNSILPTDYAFTPAIDTAFWTADPSIVATAGNTITVTPTAVGTQCYTYNVVDDFGCTYTQEICIDVKPGVSLNTLVAAPTTVDSGQTGVFTLSNGTPNAVATYNINGGPNQTVLLDATGAATVTVTNILVATTLNVVLVAEQPTPTTGNVIATTGGANPNNSVGPILAAGTPANATNSTTVNNANRVVVMTLGDVLPAGTPITISLARNNNAGSVTITDGVTTEIFNAGPNNILQHITFITGVNTDEITFTRNNGNVLVDGIEYVFDLPGCDAPVNLSETITINPFPTVTSITNPTNICSGEDAVFVIQASPNSVVTYNINGGADATVPIDANGVGTVTVTNPNATVVIGVTSITQGVNTNDTISLTSTILINPIGQVETILPQTICEAQASTAIVFSTTATTGTTTYTWTNDNIAIGLAASSNGPATGIPSFTATNTTSAPIVATIEVTPTYSEGGADCVGTPITFTITVNPTPQITDKTASICSEATFTVAPVDGAAGDIVPAGTTYSWTVSANANVLGASAQNNQAAISQQLENTSTTVQTVTYTITPVGGNTCEGTPFELVVSVEPQPVVVATPDISFICSNSSTNIVLSSTTVGSSAISYTWTASVLTTPTGGTITGFSNDATGTATNIVQQLVNTGLTSGTVRYVVTPTIGSCVGLPINVDVTVNPIGQVNTIAAVVVCTGDVIAAIPFATNNLDNTTYTWTNSNTTIGLAAAGTSNGLPSFTAVNTGTSPVVATITVTPTYSNGGVDCVGVATTFEITINPSPTLVLSSDAGTDNQIKCVNTSITPIQYTFASGATGVTVMGLPAGVTASTNGSVVTISGTPTSAIAATFTYTITATGSTCGAPEVTGTITLTSGILPLFNQVAPVCKNATIAIPTTSTNGIVGVWQLVSSTETAANYEFIPNPNQCALGTTMTVVIKPLPTVIAVVAQTEICNGGVFDVILNSDVPAVEFNWVATATNIVGHSSSVLGSGATTINQTLTLVNPLLGGQVSYLIFAEADGCLGAPQVVVVNVNPIPNVIITPPTETICSGGTTSISLSGSLNNTVFSWSVVNSVGVAGASNGTGSSINQVLVTTGLNAGTVVYEVTPTLNGCTGTPQTITVTVNPVPQITASAHPEICSGEPTNIDFSSPFGTTVYNWEVDANGVTGASAGTLTGPSISIVQTLETEGNVRGYVDYFVTPVLNNCPGTTVVVRVYVNPLPVVSLTDGTICVDVDGTPFQSYVLNSGLDNVNYTFTWFLNDVQIRNAVEATYAATETGTYSVIAVNNTTNCISNTASAIVTETVPATDLSITQTNYFSDNATVIVTAVVDNGVLLYQLDDADFQESNEFNNVTGGVHTITVVDTQGCTFLTQEFIVIDYPKYFTPNGDGINDEWKISLLDQPDAKLYIFDRYGKLIKQIGTTDSSEGWDGTYNGALLPSTDYWFTLDYMENDAKKQFKAHFSLKR